MALQGLFCNNGMEFGDDHERLYDLLYNTLWGCDCDRDPNHPPEPRKRRTLVKAKLWEYLRDLLLNPKYCPDIIRWKNKEELMFQIVHPEEVASLWGIKRYNHPLDEYELTGLLMDYTNKRLLFQVIDTDFVYKFNPEIVDVTMLTPNQRLDEDLSYYYKKKILLPVMGNRLVYKFGPHGVEWRKKTPNLKK